jgi:hypothetical protein
VRCSRNHGTEPESKRRRAMLTLRPQVETIFQSQEKLPTSASYLFVTPQEEILNLPTSTLTSWIFKAKNRIHRIQRQEKQQQKHKPKIHPFFTRKKATAIIQPIIKHAKQKRDCRMPTSILQFFPSLPKHKRSHKNNSKDDLYPP